MKCKAHLSKSEQAGLHDASHIIAAGNEGEDELAKEGTRDDSFQSILYDAHNAAVEASRAIINYIGNIIRRAKGGERWPDVVGEKDEPWTRAVPILACPTR